VVFQIIETSRSEESTGHVHRLYFQGPNTFSEPWHLPHCPPEQVKDIVYVFIPYSGCVLCSMFQFMLCKIDLLTITYITSCCRYEDAFNRFVDEINSLATYEWWEGSIYSILCVAAYPLAWSWLQRCRRKKLQKLREFVRSEYDHACLRSCRSRALYEGLKVLQTKFYGFVPLP
jgi:hypothetical protein